MYDRNLRCVHIDVSRTEFNEVITTFSNSCGYEISLKIETNNLISKLSYDSTLDAILISLLVLLTVLEIKCIHSLLQGFNSDLFQLFSCNGLHTLIYVRFK